MPVPDEVEDMITGNRLSAHLATSVDGRPHVAPIWYLYDNETIFTITGGIKVRNIERNDFVSLSIEKSDENEVYWSVTMLGRAEIIRDDLQKERINNQMRQKYYDSTDEMSVQGNPNESLVSIDIGTTTYQYYV